LADEFFRQLESLDLSDGKRCPGEQTCSQRLIDKKPNPDKGPLAITQNADLSTEEICAGCSKFGTKPGTEAPHLSAVLNLALYLDKLREAGASFPYPNCFPSPYWWSALAGSKQGRNRHDEARDKRRESKDTSQNRAEAMKKILASKGK
jgi:hypothetical protein